MRHSEPGDPDSKLMYRNEYGPATLIERGLKENHVHGHFVGINSQGLTTPRAVSYHSLAEKRGSQIQRKGPNEWLSYKQSLCKYAPKLITLSRQLRMMLTF
jgi:hypothetical protein